MKKFFHPKGQTIIELILAMGLAAVIFPTLLAGFMSSREGKVQQGMRMQAITLLKESEQALRSIRSNGWDAFAVNGTYHVSLVGSTWVLAANSVTTNGFTQQAVISDVNRNSNGDIVTSGGVFDPSTKKVVYTISWTQPIASSITSTIYFARTGNRTVTHSTATEFNLGTLTTTQVTNITGGEVILGNNNKGKWCSPSFSSTTIDLPDGPPVAVAATASATNVHTANDVFVATAPNTSSSIKMAYVKVAADTDSPIATQEGIFTMDPSKYSGSTFPSGTGLDNSFRTNDVKYYKSASGKTYALLATTKYDKEVVAIQINDGSGNSYQDPVNKIYKYWTYFNTLPYAGATATTAFLDPSSNAAETNNAGDNDGFGSNPTRVYSDNNSFAVDTNSGNGTSTSCTSTQKDKHKFYDYNIQFPTGATVNGIEVRLDAKADSTSGSPVMCVQLSWDGGTTWTTAKSTSTLTTGEVTYTLGSSADTWGHTWSSSELSNANFRVRVINVSSDTLRDFSLDWAAVKIYSNSTANDYDAFDYGANTLSVLGDKGYVASGGYLYVFDLSNIDSKTTSNGLDMVGCRIELDGYSCLPGSPGIDKKYKTGETASNWTDTASPAHNDCSDGGNVELYADEDIAPVKVGANTYVYVAVGGGTNPEFEIVDISSVPTSGSSPAISSTSCGTIASGNSGWKRGSTLDFNSISNTEEAANSVYAKSDGTRAYISSNGGIDGNSDGKADSNQFYVINTTNKASPAFLSTNADGTAKTGFFNGSGANAQMYPRRSLTVQDGVRAVLVGKDGKVDANDAQEYQVTDMTTEATPAACGGLNYDFGFNDLTSVSELDGDNYVYMVSNTTTNELKIIQGGPDSAIYVPSGVFESQTIDASASAAFNRFTATISMPTSTSISAQVATAPAVGGNCLAATFSFVGPNGDPNAFFSIKAASLSGIIPYGSFISNAYQNPGRCFRYKTYMSTSDQTKTPTLYDVITNYSP